MNARTTRWLLALVAGLFAYIYFFERHRDDVAKKGPVAAPLLAGFRPENIHSVEILRSNAVIRVERARDGWRLTTPSYPAQRTKVEGLVETVGRLTRRGYIPASEILAQGGLAAFGLEPAFATLVLQRDEGSIQMRLGSRAPAGGQFYLQIVGEDGVVAVDDALLERLPGGINDWRDPQLFSLGGLAWNRVEIRAGQREIRVERDAAAGHWRMLRPLPARADGRMVERLVTELQATRVSRFVTEQPGVDLEPFGLQTPEFVFTLGNGTNHVLTLEFGRSPSNDVSQVFVRRSAQTNIVLVSRSQVESLRVPYTAFLERHLASVPAGTVDRVEVRGGESFTLQRQTNHLWQVITASEAFDADRDLVAEFLRDLAGLEVAGIAKDVVTELDLPTYGLAPPTRSFVLKSAPAEGAPGVTNNLLAQVDFGLAQTNHIFARRSDESTVYLVQQAATARLPAAALALRDRQVWNFTTNQVASVSLRSGGQSRKLARSPKGDWSVPGSGPVAPPLGLEEMLYRLGQLKALAWTARKPESLAPYGVREGEQEVSVEIRTGDAARVLTLQFGAFSPASNPYVTTAIGDDRFVFEVPLTVYAPFLEVLRDLKLPAPVAP
jgi:hypothetical protein